MPINEKYIKKYHSMIAWCKELNMSDTEINNKIFLLELKNGYTPLSLSDLENLNKEKLSEVLSICWENGKYRCHSIGIDNVSIETSKALFKVTWQDSNGDPLLYLEKNEIIDNITSDGDWYYGLYIK